MYKKTKVLFRIIRIFQGMNLILPILLLLSFPVWSEEICEPFTPVEQLDKWGQNLQIQNQWEPCRRFGILDASLLKEPEKIDPLILSFYRQNELKLIDPLGDYALTKASSGNFKDALAKLLKKKTTSIDKEVLAEAKACAKVLFSLEDEEILLYGKNNLYITSPEYLQDKKRLEEVIAGKNETEKSKARALFEAGKIQVESKRSPLNHKQLTLDIINIIQEEEKNGITASIGEKHKWSEEFKKNRKLFSSDTLKSIPSKILSTLSGGRSEALLVTGQEKALREFLLSSEDQSITPQELFRKSYQLNKGNIYLSLLSIENALSKYWLTPNRAQLVQTQKLKPFSKVFGSHGDVFGHWYHLFGMIYYGYADGGFMAKVAGKTESLGSLVLSGFKNERQENRINMDAGKVGSELRRFMKSKAAGKTHKINISKTEQEDDDLNREIAKALNKAMK